MLYLAYAPTFSVVVVVVVVVVVGGGGGGGGYLNIVVINCGSTDLCNPACNFASSDFV